MRRCCRCCRSRIRATGFSALPRISPATNRKRKRDHPPAPNPHRFIDRETEVREYLETNPEGHWSDALSPEQLIACCPNATDDQVISGAFTFAGEDINGNPLCRRLTFVGSALKKLSLGEKILHGLDLLWGVDFSEFQKKAKERFPDEQSRFNFWKSCIDEVVQNQLTDEAKKSAKKDFRGIPWRLNAYVDALLSRYGVTLLHPALMGSRAATSAPHPHAPGPPHTMDGDQAPPLPLIWGRRGRLLALLFFVR